MKFSIIVPVYNAGEYLDRCINCIIAQTYSDWELILINDGSTDNSREIIESFAEKDSRIRGIHQQNAGPGKARNAGLASIEGDYVVFVDADDYIDPDYLMLLSPLAEVNDLVFIDVVRVDLDGGVTKAEKMSEYCDCTKQQVLRGMMTGKIPWGGVRKTISAKLVKENELRYSDIKIGEEALFSFRALYCAESVGFLAEKPVYMYEVHSQSQSNLKMDDPWGPTYLALREYLEQSGLYDEFADTLNAFNIVSTIVSIDRITLNHPRKECRGYVKQRIALYNDRIDKNKGIDKASMPNKAKIMLPLLKMKLIGVMMLICNLRRKLR